jgi:hypothetical protein
MEKFIKLSSQERKNVIQKAAFDLGLRFDVVEKDIWVCFVLDKLFSLKEFNGKLVFKGGTCLSKAYNLISRFSEDVDITINKSCLETKGTSSKSKKIKSDVKHASAQFVKDKICKSLNEVFTKELKGNKWSLEIDNEDKSTLIFSFPFANSPFPPHALPFTPLENYGYIKPSIKLEFGALGDDWPSEEKSVEPYARKILPDYFQATQVKVLDAKRNFLEKLLILHSVYCRPIDKKLRNHYSRHYYDVFALIKAGIGKDAIKLPDVLQSVVENKITFWNQSWKPYDMIKSFSDIMLVPQDQSRLKELEADYEKMKEMFFKDYPTFSEIVDELKKFEKILLKTSGTQVVK